MESKSGMSKKTAMAATAVAAVSASNDVNTQLVIMGIAVVAILVQGFLDYRKD